MATTAAFEAWVSLVSRNIQSEMAEETVAVARVLNPEDPEAALELAERAINRFRQVQGRNRGRWATIRENWMADR